MFRVKIDLEEFEGTTERLLNRVKQLETDVCDKLHSQMIHHLAKLLEEQARLRAPVLDGNTEGAIHGEVYYYDGRKKAKVTFKSGELPRDYGWAIHEGYYKLGERSEIKQSFVSVRVGRKFIERALREEQPRYERYIKNKLWRYFKDGH